MFTINMVFSTVAFDFFLFLFLLFKIFFLYLNHEWVFIFIENNCRLFFFLQQSCYSSSFLIVVVQWSSPLLEGTLESRVWDPLTGGGVALLAPEPFSTEATS